MGYVTIWYESLVFSAWVAWDEYMLNIVFDAEAEPIDCWMDEPFLGNNIICFLEFEKF